MPKVHITFYTFYFSPLGLKKKKSHLYLKWHSKRTLKILNKLSNSILSKSGCCLKNGHHREEVSLSSKRWSKRTIFRSILQLTRTFAHHMYVDVKLWTPAENFSALPMNSRVGNTIHSLLAHWQNTPLTALSPRVELWPRPALGKEMLVIRTATDENAYCLVVPMTARRNHHMHFTMATDALTWKWNAFNNSPGLTRIGSFSLEVCS